MAQPVQITYNLAAASSVLLFNSATATFTSSLVLNTAIVDANQRRVLITSDTNDVATIFTIVGTNQAGFPITETVVGPNASTTQTNQDFKTVTRVGVSATSAGKISLGTDNNGSTLWYITNQNAAPVNIEASGVVTSPSTTVTWGVQYTYDDPNNLPAGVGTAQPFNHPTLVALAGTTSLDGPINDPVMAVRGIVTLGTGTVRFTFIEAGLGSP